MKRLLSRAGRLTAIAILGMAGLPFSAAAADLRQSMKQIRLPAGFQIEIFADHIENARSMALSHQGTLFVGTRSKGNVYAVRNGEVITLAKGLENPNGVAFRDGSLYVMERSRLLRFDAIEAHLKSPPKPVVVRPDYPTEAHHGWKFIAFGPDGRLYIPVGAPCNACRSEDPIYATITRLSTDGRHREVFASGVRNTVGFDWHPETKDLWFTDNGRDEMGDDVPPDELNVASKKGLDFGFPYCQGGDLADPELGQEKPCSDFVPPARKLGPHVAALGMRFYTGTMFPSEYKNSIFIAEHGSWNRSRPIGYRITLVRLEGNKAVSYTVFAEGWLPTSTAPEDPHQPNTLRADESADSWKWAKKAKKTQAWGRPVDLLVMPDGSLLVSDDEADAIYRITYQKPST